VEPVYSGEERKGKVMPKEIDLFIASINSYLGMMRHWNTSRLRGKLLGELSGWWWNYICSSGAAFKLVKRLKTR
jgi:hypothetical protein